jgi:hypothetical protein
LPLELRPEGKHAKLRGLTVRILGKVIYWLAVLAISVVLLIVLVLFFESRDESEVEGTSVGLRA